MSSQPLCSSCPAVVPSTALTVVVWLGASSPTSTCPGTCFRKRATQTVCPPLFPPQTMGIQSDQCGKQSFYPNYLISFLPGQRYLPENPPPVPIETSYGLVGNTCVPEGTKHVSFLGFTNRLSAEVHKHAHGSEGLKRQPSFKFRICHLELKALGR